MADVHSKNVQKMRNSEILHRLENDRVSSEKDKTLLSSRN